MQGNSLPSPNPLNVQVGLEYNNEKTKFKSVFDWRKYTETVTLSHRQCSRFLLGAHLNFDVKALKATEYHLGAVYEPADKCLVGVKHESTKDAKEYQLGKFFFYFFHQASAINTIGTEFSLDYQKKVVEARMGLTHKFDDQNTGKLKVNHAGHIDFLLKHKCCDMLTIAAVSSINAKAIPSGKAGALPLGLSLDIKY